MVRAAVYHLQHADASLRAELNQTVSLEFRKIFRHFATAALVDRHEFVLCLLAACYRYLGEHQLSEAAIRKAHGIRKRVLEMDKLDTVMIGVVSYFNPVTYVDLFRPSPVKVYDVAIFEEKLRQLPSNST